MFYNQEGTKEMKKLIRYGAMGTVFASGLVVAACANYESGSGGNIYANFPVTEKTYKGSKKTSVSYTGQIARHTCLLYTSPSPRDRQKSRMPSSA